METSTFAHAPFSNDSTPNSSANFESSEIEDALEMLERGRNIAIATVFSFGLFFNTLALLVLLRSKSLRSKTTGRLLAALAVADSTYLLGIVREFYVLLSVYKQVRTCTCTSLFFASR